MSVNSVSSSAAVGQAVNQPVLKQAPADQSSQPRTDRLELSGLSHLMRSLKDNNGVRTEKIAAIRAQIQAGTYEDDKKMDVAIDRLLDDLLG